MTTDTTQLDGLILKRWTDAIAFRDAIGAFEDRLSEALERAAESLRPWLEGIGYTFLEVEAKYARINVARSSWLNRKTRQPWAWFALDALYPYGFRRVQEEHPSVWIATYNLDKEDRKVFQEQLLSRLTGKEGSWLNEECGRDYPAGRYINTCSDRERLELAANPDKLAPFARSALESILVLGDDVEAALRITRGA